MSFTNEKVTEYLDSFYKAPDEDLRNYRELNEKIGVPLILRETESLLSLLLEMTNPSRVLEIGTAYGYSALYFAKKLPSAHITTIDRNPHMIPAAEAAFAERTEGERIRFIQGEAGAMLDQLIADNEASDTPELYDFIFIDAGKSHYREFFDKAEKLSSSGAMIVCDNILMHGWTVDRSYEGAYRHRTNVKYMRQFIEYITEREDLTVSLLASGDGLAIIKLHE